MSVIAVTKETFTQEVLESSVPVLLDFWAPWCGPCKAIAPILEDVATEKSGDLKIVKVNVDENSELAVQFAVRGIPTLLLFKGGDVVANKVGASGKEDLLAWIENSLA